MHVGRKGNSWPRPARGRREGRWCGGGSLWRNSVCKVSFSSLSFRTK